MSKPIHKPDLLDAYKLFEHSNIPYIKYRKLTIDIDSVVAGFVNDEPVIYAFIDAFMIDNGSLDDININDIILIKKTSLKIQAGIAKSKNVPLLLVLHNRDLTDFIIYDIIYLKRKLLYAKVGRFSNLEYSDYIGCLKLKNT